MDSTFAIFFRSKMPRALKTAAIAGAFGVSMYFFKCAETQAPLDDEKTDSLRIEKLDNEIISRGEFKVGFTDLIEIVDKSQAVVATKIEVVDGKFLQYVEEFLSIDQNFEFSYMIGDEVIEARSEEPVAGEGCILSFAGDPAILKFEGSIVNGRIPALGDITVDELRARLAGSVK